MKHAWTVLFAALLLTAVTGSGGSPKPNYAFQNRKWWDGSGYKQGTLYSVGEIVSSKQPIHLDHTFDLHGGYVIPPLAEGHNHWLEPSKIDDYNSCYLADGVYYVRDMDIQLSQSSCKRPRHSKCGGVYRIRPRAHADWSCRERERGSRTGLNRKNVRRPAPQTS